MIDIMKEGLAKWNIPATPEQLEKFQKYMDLVLENNQKVNLTAITDPETFHVKHFLDSVVIYNKEEFHQARTIIDVGTGGGFPGVPLAILSPEKEFVLMDSLRKRVDLVREMCRKCGIDNVRTIHARAEDLGRDKEHRDHYDLCVSRAVADLAVLAEYCLPFVQEGGCFLSYKSGDIDEEVAGAFNAIHALGAKPGGCYREEFYGQKRTILIINKVYPTPARYPRKAGKPAKAPIR